MSKKDVPLETRECKSFVKFLEEKNEILAWKKLPPILFSKLTQDFYLPLKGLRKIKYLQKMQAEGKRPGVPDFLLLIPGQASTTGKSLLFFVEMKRQKYTPSDVKPEQVQWVQALENVADVSAKVCGGSAEAKIFISQYLKY